MVHLWVHGAKWKGEEKRSGVGEAWGEGLGVSGRVNQSGMEPLFLL